MVLRKQITIGIVLISSVLLGGCVSESSDRYGIYDNTDNYHETKITSDNWECTDDCSGHDAGYEWASNNGITDPDDCGGKSESFIEGCQAWANEQEMDSYNEPDAGEYGYY